MAMRKLIFVVCLIAGAYSSHIGDVVRIAQPSKQTADINNLISLLKNVAQEKISPREGIEANLNDYADQIFENLQTLMVEDGFDPLELPEVSEGFNYTLIITYHGELNLTKGWLSDISTIHRGGDVIVSYNTDEKFLEVTVPIAFDDLQITYDYAAQIMGLGPVGYLTGVVRDLALEVKLGFNVETLEFSLDEFDIVHAGNIDVEFHGDALVDWLLDALAFVATNILKEVVLVVVQDVIRGGLQDAVDQINDAINGFLNPTTSVPSTTVASLYFR